MPSQVTLLEVNAWSFIKRLLEGAETRLVLGVERIVLRCLLPAQGTLLQTIFLPRLLVEMHSHRELTCLARTLQLHVRLLYFGV
jgi:hypothetical protein